MTSYESPGTHKSIRNGRFEFNNSRANQHNLWIISFAIFSVMRFPFSYATTFTVSSVVLAERVEIVSSEEPLFAVLLRFVCHQRHEDRGFVIAANKW